MAGGRQRRAWLIRQHAVSASTLWFLSLSLGVQMLASLFRKPIAWRVLDSLVCVTMGTIAGSFIIHGVDV